jgi:regulator of protease activity HflC (stomatin/prohibitin superfamily)
MRSEKLLEGIILIVLLLLVFLAVSKFIAWVRSLFYWITIYPHERGLHFHDGKLNRVLEAGRYFMVRGRDVVTNVDMRQTVLNVVNQEVICADSFSVRVSASVFYRVIDPVVANEKVKNAYETLYLETQLVVRETISGLKVEEVVLQRNDLSAKLEEALKPRVTGFGLEIDRAGIRDITFPADVKKAMKQVASAEKAAQASLAKSRAETASLRALANAAKMIEGNPNLLALRSLHSISELTNSTGNTIVLGVPSPMVPLGGGASKPSPTVEPVEE